MCAMKTLFLGQIGFLKALLFQVMGCFLAQNKMQGIGHVVNLWHFIYWECVSPYTQPCSPVLLLKGDGCFQSCVLSQLLFFTFLYLNRWSCSYAAWLSWYERKNCVKWKMNIFIWAATSSINWDTVGLRKGNVHLRPWVTSSTGGDVAKSCRKKMRGKSPFRT